ncbi:MAG: hypothetical protein ABI172_11430 [Ginsengibacter sp.]
MMNITAYLILFIIVGIILLASLIIFLSNYRKRKEKERLENEFDNFALENKLSIDKKQTLNKNMIGIDRENMKLIFVDRSNIPQQIELINLNELSSCNLITQTNADKGYISNISVECAFKETNKPEILLPFYDEGKDNFNKMMRLSKKASYWEKAINLFRTEN